MSKQLSLRASLLSGAAYLYAILPLAVPPVLLLAATPAHADGGSGGAAGTSALAGGAGGTGDNATAGVNGSSSGASASGGGGGGAGGGAGGKGGSGNGSGGAGGAGGTATSTAGLAGSAGTGGGAGGGGGGGFNASNVATITNPSLTIITGGAGGAGGSGTSGSTSAGGGGGAGGYGVVITGATSNTNAGTISGGVGGVGGTGYGTNVTGGDGGDGGVGVTEADGNSFLNTGTISGGNGGLGGTGSNGATTGNAGLGGVGFEGYGVSLTNAGTISGGADGGTTTLADAIVFTGGVNTLTLEAGSTINGNVVAFSSADTLALGGSANATFDVSQIGGTVDATNYDGFGSYLKTGAGTWVLTGVATVATPWTINQGVLSISNVASLGITGSTVTFTGGTLQFTSAAMVDALPFTLSTGGGTIDTDGFTVTVDAVVNGNGALTVMSSSTPGTLILEANNTYSGGTTIATGMTLQVGTGTTTGAITGAVANSGKLVFDVDGNNSETGVISGTGSLTQEGTGVLTLSNLSNTYSGGTIVSAGLINFNGVGDFGSGATPNITLDGGGLQWATGTTTDISGDLKALAGNPANGGTTFDTNGNNVSFAHALTGTGGITKAGAGTLIFSVDNSYSGTTTVAGGLIRFKDAGAFGSAPSITLNGGGLQWATSYAGGDISADLSAIGTNGATFDTNGNTITLATALTGMGGVTVQDSNATPGKLILTAAETYSGTTTIASMGTLQLGDGTTPGTLASSSVVDDGTLIFDLPSSATVAIPISGTGALTLTGGGAVTLSNTINLGGAVSLGNGLVVNAAGNSSLTGVISGAGSLTMGGVGGILTLSNAANAYTGGTTVTGGLINFNSLGNFGEQLTKAIGTGLVTLDGGGLQWAKSTTTDVSGNLTAIGSGGATFDTNGNNVTFATTLTDGSSGGGVTKQGLGTLTFTVANTYGGPTTVNGGLIDFGAVDEFGSATPSIVLNGGGLQWSKSQATPIDISPYLAPIGANGATFDTNGNDVTLGTELTGSGGITKTGAGTLTLGTTEGYSGATIVNGGTLLVTGSLASSTQGVLVLSGGTFEGTGTIAGTGTAAGTNTIAALNVLSGGIASPGVGATTGTIHVQGYADLQIGSELVINLTHTNGNSSQLVATGTALLAGQLMLDPANGTYSLSEQYTILTAAGGVTGQFSGITVNENFGALANGAELVPEVSYGTDDAVVTLDAGTISPFLTNGGTNQKNVALAIDHAMEDDGAVTTFAPLTGSTNLNSALSDFTGEVGPATQSVELGQSESFLGTLQDAASVGVPSTGARFASRYAFQQFDDASAVGQGYVTPSYGNSGLDLWADVRAGQNQYDGSSSLGTHSTQATDYGGVVGFGFRAPSGRATFGIAMDYDDLDWSLSDALGKGRATAYQGGLYGSLLFGNAYVSAVGSFEEYNVTTNRTVVMPTMPTPTSYSYQAKFTTDGEGGHIEGGQRLPTGDGWITPYLGVTLEDIHTPTYSETSVGVSPMTFALSYAKGTHTDISAELGAAYDSAFGSPRVDLFSFHMKLGWLHDFTTGLSDTATFEDFAGATFTVHGAPPSSDAAHLVLGIEQDYQGLALTLDAQGLAGTSGYSIGGNAGIAYRW